jgi:predicted O-methyltransferase YrrM
MLHALKHYLKHLVKSIHLHGIHSPFVFSLQHTCFYGTTATNDLNALKIYRKSLKLDTTVITIKDRGAGSKRFRNSTRTIADILRVNCTTSSRTALLTRICNYLNVKTALELGTSLGVGTHALSLNGAMVTSVEASQSMYDYTSSNLKEYDNINLIHGSFKAFLNDELSQKPQGTYDLIFIDGDRNGAATIAYFEKLLAFAHIDTIFILDDIYWSKDMTRAWEILIKHKEVTASIDSFYWGFLFLRKEQSQQAFHVRL